MPIRCECGHCKTEFWAPDKFAGRTLACPVCEKWVSAPGGKPGAGVAPEPAPPAPLPDILDEAMGRSAVPMGIAGGGPGVSALGLDDAWASDGTWQGARRRSRRETVRIPLQAGIAIFAIGGLVFYGLIIAALPKPAVVIGWILFWTGGVGLLLVGLGWEALIAMREREGPGIFVLIPPLDLYYFMSQWDKTRKAFLATLAGAVICAGSFGTIRLAEYLAGRQDEQAAGTVSPTATPVAPKPVPPASGIARKDTPAPRTQVVAPKGSPPPRPADDQTAAPGLQAPPPAQAAIPQAVPDAEADLNPIQGAFEETSRQYAIQTAVDLIAGDDATLGYRMRWFPAGARPVIGLRWAVGVELRDPADPALRAAVKDGASLIGAVAMHLVSGLENRIKAGAYGDWPDQGDPRCRQVAILPTGTRQQLIAGARSRRLDMLIVLEPVPLASAGAQFSQTLVQAHVLDVVAQRPLWTSQAFGSAAAGPASAAGWDPVAMRAGEILAYLRDRCELTPVPALTAEQARARIKQQAPDDGRPTSRMGAVVELRYYQAKQILPAEEVAKELDALVGLGRGRLLATEPPKTRRELIQAWLKGL